MGKGKANLLKGRMGKAAQIFRLLENLDEIVRRALRLLRVRRSATARKIVVKNCSKNWSENYHKNYSKNYSTISTKYYICIYIVS